jgi:hypothetical protein
MTSPSLVVPRTGPCSPWITSAAILSYPKCGDIDEAIAATMATVASEVLYHLSGQQFTGACGPVEVRPVSRPYDIDTRAFGSMIPGGYMSSWGTCSAYGTPGVGGVSHYGCSLPPEVELGAYPVTAIDQVKIDGILIPPNEYYIQDYKVLVRRRISAASTPTDRWGWPTCQVLDLPDSEQGTFSVTYYYGVPPPDSGVLAATVLAAQLALNASGKPDRLPQRITSITRQGVTAAVVDVMDFLKNGQTGIYEVDLFIRTFNESGARKKSMVWSPDMGRPRRLPPGVT